MSPILKMRFVCAWLAVLSLPSPPAMAASVADFVDFSLITGDGAVLYPGRLYVPPEAVADPATPRPFILYMHGAGARGSNNLNQLNDGIDPLLAEAKQRGAFLYAPQITNEWYHVAPQTGLMLDRALATYNVDPDRLYVTGVSLGGGGVWSMLSSHPTRFAAALPISGSLGVFLPPHLVDQSIWAFHARNDDVVSVNTSRATVSAILSAAGEATPSFPSISNTTITVDFVSSAIDLRYTEYPFGAHNISGAVYTNELVYDWMFSHTLAVPEPGSVCMLAIGAVLLVASHVRRRSRKEHARATAVRVT